MKKRNEEALKEVLSIYNGSLEEFDYSEIVEFLETLNAEGILDETEQEAFENLYYTGKCTEEEYTYVKETMKLWDEDEYMRRLTIVNGY